MVFTHFWDMHSGGGQKEKWNHIYIEAGEEEAKIIFYNRFGHNPDRITCTCCGNDYSISEEETLEQATGFQRKCKFVYKDKNGNIIPDKDAWISGEGITKNVVWKGYIEQRDDEAIKDMKNKYPTNDWEEYYRYVPLIEYLAQDGILVIKAEDIKEKDRQGKVPQQGYVWVD
jgi:hypothetical protein